MTAVESRSPNDLPARSQVIFTSGQTRRTRTQNFTLSTMRADDLKLRFQQMFGQDCSVYRAPGRVNLIGEHTDYNDGFVFPAAIDRGTWVGIAPRADRLIVAHSENFQERIEIDLDGALPVQRGHWSRYVGGIAQVLEARNYRLCGANLLIHGNIPIGSGLSSSASLEVAVGFALLQIAGLTIERSVLAKLCQKAENEIVGTQCGIMDQLASCCGEKGSALLMDCRSLRLRAYPLPKNLRIVICNTMVKRELAKSAYNERRSQCEEGVKILAGDLPGIRALRDVNVEQLERYRTRLADLIYRRCRHVVTENARVLRAADALERGLFSALGEAMAESHRSLRDDYEVSCAELDLFVELAGSFEGTVGARMTGAGFGGCTVNLVDSDRVGAFQQKVASEYQKRTGINPEIYVCQSEDGVSLVL